MHRISTHRLTAMLLSVCLFMCPSLTACGAGSQKEDAQDSAADTVETVTEAVTEPTTVLVTEPPTTTTTEPEPVVYRSPMTNEIITLVKDTSLAFAIGCAEMFTVAKSIVASTRMMWAFVASAAFYYVFNLVVAFIMNRVERRLSYYHD